MRLPLLGLVFLLACGGSSHGPADASGPGDGSSGGGGDPCGGRMASACSATEYCDYPDNGCGMGDQTGTCKPRPDVCPVSATPAAPPAVVATQPTSDCHSAAL